MQTDQPLQDTANLNVVREFLATSSHRKSSVSFVGVQSSASAYRASRTPEKTATTPPKMDGHELEVSKPKGPLARVSLFAFASTHLARVARIGRSALALLRTASLVGCSIRPRIAALVALAVSIAILGTMPGTVMGQRARIVKSYEIEGGTVIAIKPGEITIKQDSDNKTVTHKIQDKGERAVSIGGRPVNIPAKIKAAGAIPASLAERGMIVKFTGRSNLYGKSNGEVKTIEALNVESTPELMVDFQERPETNSEPAKCVVVGRVVNFTGTKLQLEVPKAKWAKKERIVFKIAEDGVLLISDDNLKRVVPGDKVTRANVLELSTGDTAIKSIEFELVAERSKLTTSFNEQLEQKFSNLSDKPAKPRELRSDHFILFTDLSDRSANVLLAKLETMYDLVSGYYSARPVNPIECYVVRDMSQWQGKFEPAIAAKILEPAGVTRSLVSRRQGKAKAIVYSCAKHSVVQHEAVHAFCIQTFGSTGPVWYSEGMAEMGQYWKPGELAVNIDSIVISYLTRAKPKKLADIVAAGQITGDSWQAYAWRWALCHMLANNPNYSKRFKKLGLNLMADRPDSFEATFGKLADKISFEYDQFVENFGNGYRVDLCAWEWKSSSNISSDQRVKQKVRPNRGWQATKLKTREGVTYQYVAEGNWKTAAKGDETTADGDSNGRGRLMGVIFKDFQLGKPFEMGTKGEFTAQVEGQLYVRCRDEWTGLQDNDGDMQMHLRRKPK